MHDETLDTPRLSRHECFQRIYALVRQVPRGRVVTYGQVAAEVAHLCPSPVPAITVGRAMAASVREAPDIPWWRVIGRNGRVGVLRKLSLSHEQADLLAAEGILPDAEGRYELERYEYHNFICEKPPMTQ
jgi:methylated-DNA-protein-cysteine methyltransferase-like protein